MAAIQPDNMGLWQRLKRMCWILSSARGLLCQLDNLYRRGQHGFCTFQIGTLRIVVVREKSCVVIQETEKSRRPGASSGEKIVSCFFQNKAQIPSKHLIYHAKSVPENPSRHWESCTPFRSLTAGVSNWGMHHRPVPRLHGKRVYQTDIPHPWVKKKKEKQRTECKFSSALEIFLKCPMQVIGHNWEKLSFCTPLSHHYQIRCVSVGETRKELDYICL